MKGHDEIIEAINAVYPKSSQLSTSIWFSNLITLIQFLFMNSTSEGYKRLLGAVFILLRKVINNIFLRKK